MNCQVCNSSDIIRGVRVVDQGHHGYKFDLKLEAYSSPGALIFKGARSGTLRANVCAKCGHVNLHVSKADAARLKTAMLGL